MSDIHDYRRLTYRLSASYMLTVGGRHICIMYNGLVDADIWLQALMPNISTGNKLSGNKLTVTA